MDYGSLGGDFLMADGACEHLYSGQVVTSLGRAVTSPSYSYAGLVKTFPYVDDPGACGQRVLGDMRTPSL